MKRWAVFSLLLLLTACQSATGTPAVTPAPLTATATEPQPSDPPPPVSTPTRTPYPTRSPTPLSPDYALFNPNQSVNWPDWFQDNRGPIFMTITEELDSYYSLSFFGETGQRFNLLIQDIAGYFWGPDSQSVGLLAAKSEAQYFIYLDTGEVRQTDSPSEILFQGMEDSQIRYYTTYEKPLPDPLLPALLDNEVDSYRFVKANSNYPVLHRPFYFTILEDPQDDRFFEGPISSKGQQLVYFYKVETNSLSLCIIDPGDTGNECERISARRPANSTGVSQFSWSQDGDSLYFLFDGNDGEPISGLFGGFCIQNLVSLSFSCPTDGLEIFTEYAPYGYSISPDEQFVAFKYAYSGLFGDDRSGTRVGFMPFGGGEFFEIGPRDSLDVIISQEGNTRTVHRLEVPFGGILWRPTNQP